MLTTGLFDARPPFVRFEQREYGLNAAESERTGRPIPRVVDMACITPHGSKDVVDKVAVEWLEQIKQKAMKGEFSPQWAEMFKLQYTEWKKGNELPREGTPVQTWPAISREQQLRLRALGQTTVEDLAQVPDGSLGEIGLDGRYLRDLARSWISESKDKGITAKQLADAQVALDQLKTENGDLRQRLAALEQAQEKRGPGRPRKTDEAA